MLVWRQVSLKHEESASWCDVVLCALNTARSPDHQENFEKDMP